MASLSSYNNDNDMVSTKTVWLLFAVAINALEFFIPRIPFFPWLKPGFANIITILWIIQYGAIDALLYSLLRIWIVGFFFGFSFLTLSLSMCGGVLSTIAMSVLWASLGKRKILGIVGVAVCGALFHNLGQLLAVYGLMAANMHLFFQLPVMFAASVIFGGAVGLLTPLFGNVLMGCSAALPSALKNPYRPLYFASRSEYWFSLFLFAGCCAIVFADSWTVLCASACGATLIVQVWRKGSFSALFAPLTSFWVLFVFIACINLLFSFGTVVESFPLVTHEGLDLTARQWLRLWTWLQVSFILSFFNFHAVMFSILQRVFPRHQSTLFAGVLSLEYFPAIASDSRAYANKAIALFFQHPIKSLKSLFDKRKKKGVSETVRNSAEILYGIVLRRMKDTVR
jgi:heptaprenyl diphosphate synthase